MRFSMIAAAAVTLVSAASVFAGPMLVSAPAESATFAGTYTQNMTTGELSNNLSPGAAIVYDANNVGTGSSWVTATAGNEIRGDYVHPAAGGKLSDFTCALFNSSTSNTGTISSGTVTVLFNTFNTTTGFPTAVIGGFSGTYDFGAAPLQAGFYTLLSFTGLEGLSTPVVLPSTDYLVTIQFTTTGSSLRQGTIYGGASSVGFSDGSGATGFWYGKGAARTEGLYAFAGDLNNQLLQVGVIAVPEPTALAAIFPAGLLLSRRRRA